MKVCIIGTGYVGLVAGAMFAKVGNKVTCVDIDAAKIEMLNKGEMPIYEPGLKQIVLDTSSEGLLAFTTEFDAAAKSAEVIFITVGTPSSDEGEFDLKYIKAAAAQIGKSIAGCDDYKIIVNKSTVPPGTADMVTNIIKENIPEELQAKTNFEVVSNPEFLKEGKAVADFDSPDRIVIGASSEKARNALEALYEPFSLKKKKLIFMKPIEAELTKLFANTILANKVARINEFAKICSLFDADIMNVRDGVCSDSRIGWEFMYPSPGYGGSCFPKDIRGLVAAVKEKGFSPKIVSSIDFSNNEHKAFMADEIKEYFSKLGGVANKTIAIWGLTFKARTDDMREAASIDIINSLIAEGAKIKAHDPKGMENAKKIFGNKIEYCDRKYDAIKDADALLLLTEWTDYRSPDFAELKNLKTQVIFDGRNIYDPERINTLGFDYIGIGRKYLSK
ncbi:UDP-glucose/GDP-mannose dehydrogenase family protein [Candidatus Woesearchaeota archaeon]|nr:UDP-glucose/GDP-mannose dehydrogenase family protein [Candidatus Woesearchaeota archaeon]